MNVVELMKAASPAGLSDEALTLAKLPGIDCNRFIPVVELAKAAYFTQWVEDRSIAESLMLMESAYYLGHMDGVKAERNKHSTATVRGRIDWYLSHGGYTDKELSRIENTLARMMLHLER